MLNHFFSEFKLQDFISATFVLFAIIDIPGALPVIINLKKKGKKVYSGKASIAALILFLIFFYVGEAFLNLFGVDISSFAIAGSLVIFIVSIEMILDIDLFNDSPESPKDATFVPIVFPLIAGAGALTTLLSIRAQYADINVLSAVFVNVFVIYLVLKLSKKIEKILSPAAIYVLKKFFGIILLAISLKLFTTNITILIESISRANHQ